MVDPSKAGEWYRRALAALGRLQRSAELLRRALELNPEDTDVACELADVFAEQGQLQKALVLYEYVLGLAPECLRALYGGGCAALAAEDFAQAEKWFSQAVRQKPEWLEARHNWGRAQYELGQVGAAYMSFDECVRMDVPGSEHSRAMRAVIVPGVAEANQTEILAVRRDWAQREELLVEAQIAPPTEIIGARSSGPIRIGYISSFFQRDNWMKPVWALINGHNRAEFQVHMFSDTAASNIRHGYRPDPRDRYSDISLLTNDEVRALLSQAGIDIAVDLNGYSNMRRLPLFAVKVAPVTMGWFNLYASSGFSTMDYLIGDEYVVLAGEETFYSEKILRVKGSYLNFSVDYPVPEVMVRTGDEPFVFGALASQYKITDEVVASWSNILRACPEASLLVKNKSMAVAGNREHLSARFGRNGVGKDRLRLEGPEEHYEFLKAYGRIDLALDTFPYNGGTTTTEALWQGVPVLTFLGDRWAARTSASLLQAGGLGEFVAENRADYETNAVAWATGRKRRARLHEMRVGMRLSLKRSQVCDCAGFAAEMERLFKLCLT